MHSVLVSAFWPQRNDSLVFKPTAVTAGSFLLAIALIPLAWQAISPMRGVGHA